MVVSTECNVVMLYVPGVREQPVGERRARRAHRARRQLRRQLHGARAADTHAEHAGTQAFTHGFTQNCHLQKLLTMRN